MSGPRKIVHLDLDCFFVSVERIKDPSLRGKPVVVGGSPQGRGVVASASYEARKFGVRSAMPTARALRLCPQLLVVGSRHGEYGAISDKLAQRMEELAPIVERASIDEMYLDVTGCEALYGNNLPWFMHTLQKLVREEFQLPCSIALATSKTIAKIAVGTVKPEGVCIVPPGSEKAFLAPLPISVIPGVGKKTEEFLKQRGFCVVSDLQRLSEHEMGKILGAHGTWLYAVVQGGGNDVVHTEHSRKSISREETFGSDIDDLSRLEEVLHDLVEDVCRTLRKDGRQAQTVGLKLRYGDFHTITRERSVDPTDDDALVYHTVRHLLRKSYERSRSVRLIGVHLSHLAAEPQMEMPFNAHSEHRDKLLKAVDAIREKHGADVIHIGRA
jgi:DNA polymerase IV